MATKPRVFVCVPPPLFEPYPFTMKKEVINEILPVKVKEIASKMQVEVIDVFNAFGDKSGLVYDGCHPNKEGSDVIAKTIYNAIH